MKKLSNKIIVNNISIFLQNFLLASVLYMAVRLGFSMYLLNSGSPPFWSFTGIALAIYLITGKKSLPGIVLGAVFGYLSVFIILGSHNYVDISRIIVLLTLSNLIEVLLGKYLLLKLIKSSDYFSTVGNIYRVCVVSMLVSLISSISTALMFGLSKFIVLNKVSFLLFNWWIGNVSGIILFLPLVISWNKDFKLTTNWKKNTEYVFLLATILVVTYYLFDIPIQSNIISSFSYLIIPILLIAIFRFEFREIITLLFFMTCLAVGRTIFSHDIKTISLIDYSLLHLELFIGLMTISTLFIAASVNENHISRSQLKLSQARLNQIINLIPSPIFSKDKSGKFIFVNQALAQAYGKKVEQITGLNQQDIHISEVEVQSYIKEDKEVINQNKKITIPEESFTDYKGNLNFFQTTKIPYKLFGTEETVMLGVSIDITQRKKTELELERYREHLEDLVENKTNQLKEINEKLLIKIQEHKKALKSLAETQKIAKLGTWEYNIEENIIECSSETNRILNIPENMVLSINSYYKLIHFEDLRILKDSIKKTIENKTPFEIEVRCKKGAGKYRYILQNGRPVLEKGKVVKIHCSILDVSNLKKVEVKLRESEEKFKTLFDKSPVGIELYDADGKLVLINNTSMKIFGIETEEKILGLSLFEDPNISFEYKKMLQDGFTVNYEKKINFDVMHRMDNYRSTKIGEKYLHVVMTPLKKGNSKEITGYFLQLQDITEEKKAISKLRILSKAIEHSPVSIIITDTNGNIEYTNPAFSNLTGYSREEIQNKNPRILKSGKHNEEFYNNMWRDIKSGKQWQGHVWNLNKAGELYLEETIISPILDENDNISHFLAVKTDITKRVQANKMLINAKNEAERANQIKNIFLANVSHEFRTPMNAIIGISKLLKANDVKNLTKEQAEGLSVIHKSGSRLMTLVNEILDLTKIESGKMEVKLETCSLKEVFNHTKDIVKSLINGRDIDYRLQLGASLPEYAKFDQKKLIQVLLNLLGNAVKFTEKGDIILKSFLKKDKLFFEIRDSGIGIAEQNLELIFMEFKQIDDGSARKYKGTGLGLTLCKKFVELMGGNIDVSSEIGVGSSFKFNIPYIRGEVSASNEIINEVINNDLLPNNTLENKEQTEQLTESKEKHKILIAEDEHIGRVTVKMMLQKQYDLVFAENGKDALNKFEREKPELILLDIMMPVLDGYQALKALRNRPGGDIIPIIALTAKAMKNERNEILSHGFDDYISKPIDDEILIEKIEMYLNKKEKP